MATNQEAKKEETKKANKTCGIIMPIAPAGADLQSVPDDFGNR